MAADPVIEPARVTDVADIMRLIRALAAYEKLEDCVMATEADLAEALFGAAPAGECLVARVGDRTIGFAIYFRNLSTFLGRAGLYLEDLFVEPEFRGRGIGRALLQTVARIAVERGCRRLDWAVLDWNAPAIGFYKSLGAEAIDEWTLFRLSDAALQRFAAEAS